MEEVRLLLTFLFLAASAWGAQPFYLVNGDRVVFYGDSITEQRLYNIFVEAYVITRFPKLDVAFVHSGWGGDTVQGGGGGSIDVRLDRDVIAHRPTVVTIALGMNDGAYRPFDPVRFAAFTSGYQHIIDRLPGVRITAIAPSAYDDITRPPLFEGGYNAVLQRYGAFVSELAHKRKLVSVDMNTPVADGLRRAQKANPDLAKDIIPDRVHPSEAAHLLMAEALLKAWGAPALVTNVSIDNASKTIAASENTSVRALQCGTDLSWTQLDSALPFPIAWDDPSDLVPFTIRSSDFMETLNRESLQIAGLQPGRYLLAIDSAMTGMFTSEELARGINLANYITPMMKQARDALYLTLKRGGVYHFRWRFLQMSLGDDRLEEQPAAVRAIDRLEQNLASRQRAAVQPVTHSYVLKRLLF
jgi:lysophospholipase L1-like esterase